MAYMDGFVRFMEGTSRVLSWAIGFAGDGSIGSWVMAQSQIGHPQGTGRFARGHPSGKILFENRLALWHSWQWNMSYKGPTDVAQLGGGISHGSPMSHDTGGAAKPHPHEESWLLRVRANLMSSIQEH